MSKRTKLAISEADMEILGRERYTHPDPRVQQRFEVLFLIGKGETQTRAGELANVSHATVERYVALYRSQGIDGLRKFHWGKTRSVLEDHREMLEDVFRKQPPHTVAEACQRIEELTGVKRGETQVRKFLKKYWD